MDLHKICRLAWIGGTILILLSWQAIVRVEVGWIGFAVAMVGSMVSRIPHASNKPADPPDDSTPLDDTEATNA